MSRVRTELRGLRRRIAERAAESDIWDAVELARHEQRPYTLDYASRMLDDFVELHGDRAVRRRSGDRGRTRRASADARSC